MDEQYHPKVKVNVCVVVPVVLQVTAAYNNTDWTLLLKILNFVLNLRELELQTYFRFINAVLAFPSLAVISASEPPCWSTTLPR